MARSRTLIKPHGLDKARQTAAAALTPSTDDLSTAIVRIGDAAEALSRSGLNRKAIVVLLADASRVGKTEINKVLDGLADLRRQYVTRG